MNQHAMGWLVVCALLGTACEKSASTAESVSGDAGAAGAPDADVAAGAGGEGGTGPGSGPVAPGDGSNGCIISADCPASTHCDLGECVQDCNADSKCGKGLVCSPRGRCIKSQELDADPPPAPEDGPHPQITLRV